MIEAQPSKGEKKNGFYRAFSHDVTAVLFLFRTNPVAVEFKVDGTSFPDAGSLVTTAHVTREISPVPELSFLPAPCRG